MSTARRSLALVTCGDIPDLAPDDQILARAAREAGWIVAATVWDDPAVDWAQFDAVLLRSTWDYHLRPTEFLAWLAACDKGGVRLWNPPATVRWNAHKGYLLDLEAHGIPVVPTTVVDRGSTVELEALLAERDWSRAVVKPAVSATAHGTYRVDRPVNRADGERFAQLLATADVLVQPFVPEILTGGELSFVFVAGEATHAASKRARPDDFRVQKEFGGRAEAFAPSSHQLEQALRIAHAIPYPHLYARLDVVERNRALIVMELELIEPELFFRFRPEAAEALIAALAAGPTSATPPA